MGRCQWVLPHGLTVLVVRVTIGAPADVTGACVVQVEEVIPRINAALKRLDATTSVKLQDHNALRCFPSSCLSKDPCLCL
jgi:hypothetical protein